VTCQFSDRQWLWQTTGIDATGRSTKRQLSTQQLDWPEKMLSVVTVAVMAAGKKGWGNGNGNNCCHHGDKR